METVCPKISGFSMTILFRRSDDADEIIALANQIRKFCDCKGEESGDNKYSIIKELLKERPDAKTIRS